MVAGGMEVLRPVLESGMGLRRGSWLSDGLEVGVSGDFESPFDPAVVLRVTCCGCFLLFPFSSCSFETSPTVFGRLWNVHPLYIGVRSSIEPSSLSRQPPSVIDQHTAMPFHPQ